MARITDVSPETLANIIGPGVAKLFEDAIKTKIREEFEALVEAAANDVCRHIETFVEGYREVSENKFVVNLYINEDKKNRGDC